MRVAVNGVHLNVERLTPVDLPDTDQRVDASGSKLVLLHGFTGSYRTWAPLAGMLGHRYEFVAVVLLGHGSSDSPADPNRYRMERCIDDLLALFDRLELERVNLLGYSMGGRVALHLALVAASRIERLILESASPGLQSPAEREARVRSDRELADSLEREGIKAFVDAWERLPLFASQARLAPEVRAALRAQRLSGDPIGLANSLRGLGAGTQEPVWDRLGDLSQPTLLMAGELDARYRALGRLMAERMPAAQLSVIPDAGHAVHLEQPAQFVEQVLSFLQTRPEMRHVLRGAGADTEVRATFN